MIKGKWVIIAVLGVALLMGLATWPLMKLRRKNEIYKTERLIEELRAACHAYKAKHGDFPRTLADLAPSRGEPLDAWGRPFKYTPMWKYSLPLKEEHRSLLPFIESLGPDDKDPGDDIPWPSPTSSVPSFPQAPRSIGPSKMDLMRAENLRYFLMSAV